MSPSISIVMPVYNGIRYLDDAIESILEQTRTDFELIVLENGSTDNSLDIVRDYAKLDKRVKVLAVAENQGPTLALKGGFSVATGTYVGWVDQDDILAPTALEETAAVLDANSQVGLVYTNYLDINENNQVIGEGHRSRIPYCKDRLLVDFMVYHFRLMRRDIFEQVGGIDERSGLVPDYDLCLRLSEVTQVEHLEKPLYYYRHHSSNTSRQNRIELLYNSQEAIARALQRRGMADNYEVELEIMGRYLIKSKVKPPAPNSTVDDGNETQQLRDEESQQSKRQIAGVAKF